MILDDIPLTSSPDEQARPSAVVARIRAYQPSRRTIIKGMLMAAAAAALVPIDWLLTRRPALAAGPTSEYGDSREPSPRDEPSEEPREDVGDGQPLRPGGLMTGRR